VSGVLGTVLVLWEGPCTADTDFAKERCDVLTFMAITDAQWGIIGTTAVALATIIVGLMASSRERRHQREMAASERRYTDEMKRRDSREKTYLELLAYLHTQLRPVVTATRLSDVPKSTDDLDVGLRARIGATASEPVRTNLDSFVETRSQIDRLVKGAAEGSVTGDAFTNFEHLREQLKDSVAAVEQNVTKELDRV